jgi:hypothetical protein
MIYATCPNPKQHKIAEEIVRGGLISYVGSADVTADMMDYFLFAQTINAIFRHNLHVSVGSLLSAGDRPLELFAESIFRLSAMKMEV